MKTKKNQNTKNGKNNRKKRVLAGIRASGELHLGNYLGAVKGMLELQNDPTYDTFYMVADAHGITTPYDPAELQKNRRSVIMDYLAAGLDPEQSTLFLQSDVSQVFELTFYFSSVATVSRMKHLPTFKEKAAQYPGNVTMALLNYPVLMAADILLYLAEYVPVGIDQLPHLEVARDIARKMNQTYGLDFPEPQHFATAGEYVPSLTGEGKMSKSIEGSYIKLTDDLEMIKQRLALAPTDSGRGEIKQVQVKTEGAKTSKTAQVEYIDQHTGKSSPGVRNLLILVEMFEGVEKRKEYEAAYQGNGLRYKDLKDSLAQAIYQELKPFQEKRAELEQQPEYVDQVIVQGAAKAKKVAAETLLTVKQKMGLSNKFTN